MVCVVGGIITSETGIGFFEFLASSIEAVGAYADVQESC
jgi:hypothetical protein